MSQALEQHLNAAEMALHLLTCYGAAQGQNPQWQRVMLHGEALLASAQALYKAHKATDCTTTAAFLHVLAQIQAQEALSDLQQLHWRYTGLSPNGGHAQTDYNAVAQTLLFTYVPIEQCGLLREQVKQTQALAMLCQANLNDEYRYAIGEHLENAADDLLQASEWMLQKVVLLQQTLEATAGMVPFARLVALVVGAQYMVRQVNEHDTRALALARFYAENLLPHSRALSISCTRGSSLLRVAA